MKLQENLSAMKSSYVSHKDETLDQQSHEGRAWKWRVA